MKSRKIGTYLGTQLLYIQSLVCRSEPVVERFYAKDRESANSSPPRPAGVDVPGCLCDTSHVSMKLTRLWEDLRIIIPQPNDAVMWYSFTE